MSFGVRHIALIAACAFALTAVTALAQESTEDAEVVLTVSGAAEAEYTIEALRAIGTVELVTSTPWTEGEQTFEGVTGAAFVEALGVHGQEVVATALNDYSVAIPFAAFDSADTLLALERNGEPMSVRDKGPIWIVFPFDQPEYDRDVYRSYAIWSLARLEFR